MKITLTAATFVFVASALAQGQSMPGMQMPGDPPKKPATQQKAKPKPKPASKVKPEAMPGMDMSKPTDKAMPGMDMSKPMDKSMPGMDMPGTAMDGSVPQAKQSGSITHDTMNLQEPENPTKKTGSNLPAPDLLTDVVERTPITLKDFLDFADRSNPTLAQANAFVRRSEAQAKQAGAYPNPTIGYSGDEIRGGSLGGGKQGAFVQQTIVLGGKRGLRRDIYSQQNRSDRTGVEVQTFRIHHDVTQAFYTTLTSQAMVVVRQRLVGIALDAVETVHQLANVGQADSPDILQAEVEAEQAKIDFVSAQREFIQNFRMLSAYAGRQDLVVSPLGGDLQQTPTIDAEKQVETIVSFSPTVKRMQQEVTTNEARLRDAKREAVPDLTVRVGEDYNREHATDQPVKAYGFESSASAGINIPLWNRNRGNADAARAEIERARKDVEREQLSLRQQAAPLAQAYQSAQFTVDRYRTQLIPRAQRAYELYLNKYQNMAMAYPQVLVSQRTLFQLQIGYLSALHDVWTNAVSLQNFNLSGGLDAPSSTGSPSTTINLPASGATVE
ncbi:TolC family protein [soil metagenome]